MDMQAALNTYFSEARELLEDMETHLLAIDSKSCEDEKESINAIFRAAHTIKGSAGLFELDRIVTFTHTVENVLDKVRDGHLVLDESLISLLFKCKDHMSLLIDETADEVTEVEQSDLVGAAITDQLSHYLSSESQPQGMALSADLSASAESLTVPNQQDEIVTHDDWHIVVEFGENSFRDGMDPMSFLSYLSTLGKITQVNPIWTRLPEDEATFNPESCYLTLEIQLDSPATRQQIEDVFEFIREDSPLHIIPPHSEIALYKELINAMPNIDLKLGEILLSCGALTEAELNSALHDQEQAKAQGQHAPVGEIIISKNKELETTVSAAVDKQQAVRTQAQKEQKSLRVDADKLDILINLIGELVTAGAGTALQAKQLGDDGMLESVSSLNGLLEEVRDAALNLRMVAIGATFSRFQRVVRDIARDLNKEVKLVITGAETELDKSVIEKVGDPLMHLVRNALDHGLESPEIRIQKNKPRTGTLSLNAYHDSGNIVIEVKDDGKGLDPALLIAKAIDKNILAEDAQLSDEDAFNLIFEPGFSTAASVSNLSGRGVGMDVVRRNITDLRGRISITSKVDQGTCIRIMLPLTLAIIDGFAIEVGNDVFVVPLDVVNECVELDIKDAKSLPRYFNLRGHVLPLLYLREQLDITAPPPRRQNIVVVQSGQEYTGIVVDRLLGELQTVIKPLGSLFSRVSGITGSTILGNGDVALILDVPGLVANLLENEQQRN